MTKQKQNRTANKLHTSSPQRLIVLLASACTGVIALYFSILAIGNFLSLFAYVIFFCCLVAPFITTHHISKWYTVITVIAAILALNTLIAASWWTVVSDFIVPFCVFYLLATIGQAIYHRKARSYKLILRSLLSVKLTSVATIGFGIGIILLSPEHFSPTSVFAVFFVVCAYKGATSKMSYQALRIFVMWLMFAFFIYALKSYELNLAHGCTGIMGARITCFSFRDWTYIFAEMVGFLLILSALFGISIQDKKVKNKRHPKRQ